MKTQTTEENYALENAKSQLASIVEMVAELRKQESAQDSDEAREAAQNAIQEDPLLVEVRFDWYCLGTESDSRPAKFRILLTTGGPACQIVGTLDAHMQPESAIIQYQDWGVPWTDYARSCDNDSLLEYCRQLYFGE